MFMTFSANTRSVEVQVYTGDSPQFAAPNLSCGATHGAVGIHIISTTLDGQRTDSATMTFTPSQARALASAILSAATEAKAMPGA